MFLLGVASGLSFFLAKLYLKMKDHNNLGLVEPALELVFDIYHDIEKSYKNKGLYGNSKLSFFLETFVRKFQDRIGREATPREKAGAILAVEAIVASDNLRKAETGQKGVDLAVDKLKEQMLEKSGKEIFSAIQKLK